MEIIHDQVAKQIMLCQEGKIDEALINFRMDKSCQHNKARHQLCSQHTEQPTANLTGWLQSVSSATSRVQKILDSPIGYSHTDWGNDVED